MIELITASVLFVATHMVISAASIRASLVAKIGKTPFMGVYSVIAFASFAWMIQTYIQAPDIAVFEPGTGLRHLTLWACRESLKKPIYEKY